MSGDAGGPDAGVPASIAAIMAAIRQEVTAPAHAAPPADDADPGPPAFVPRADATVPPPVPRESRGGTAAVSPPPHLDAEVRVLLAPLLKAWLDAHLPEIVEAAVHAEIRRLTGLNDD